MSANRKDRSDFVAPEAVASEEDVRRQAWLAGLIRIAADIAASSDLLDSTRFVYATLKPLLAPDAFMFALYDADVDELAYIFAVVDDQEVISKSRRVRIAVTGSRIEPMIRSKQPAFVDNWRYEDEHGYQVISLGQNPPRVHTLLDVPIVVGDELLGVLLLQSYKFKAWGVDVIGFASAIATLLANLVVQQRVTALSRSRQAYIDCLQRISQACITPSTPNTVLNQVAEIIAGFLDGVCVTMLKEGTRVRLASLYHSDPVVREMQTEFMNRNMAYIEQTGWGRVLKVGQPLFIPVINYAETDEWKQTQVTTIAAVPIILRGQLVGQLGMARFAPAKPLLQDDLHLLETAAALLTLALDQTPS